MRRLLLVVALGVGVYLLATRRRAREVVTVGYQDGSSVTLVDDAASVEAIRDAARGVLRA